MEIGLPPRGPGPAAGAGRRRCRGGVIDDPGGGGKERKERLEDGVDTRVVGEGQMDPVDACDRLGRRGESLGAVGFEGLRRRGGAVPDMHSVAEPEQPVDEATAEPASAEESDRFHGNGLREFRLRRHDRRRGARPRRHRSPAPRGGRRWRGGEGGARSGQFRPPRRPGGGRGSD